MKKNWLIAVDGSTFSEYAFLTTLDSYVNKQEDTIYMISCVEEIAHKLPHSQYRYELLQYC
jgi:hypothetical protein